MPATLQPKRGEKSGEPPSKAARSSGRKGGADEVNLSVPKHLEKDKEGSKLFMLLIKSILHSLQLGRDLASVVYLTWLFPVNHAVVEGGKEQNSMYSEHTYGVRGHGLGPPHIWTYGGMIKALDETLQGDAKAPEPLKQQAQQFLDTQEYALLREILLSVQPAKG